MLKSFNEFNQNLSFDRNTLLNESISIGKNNIKDVQNIDVITRLRNVLWNWSIEMLYGPNYSGNPETDNRIISPATDPKTLTAGQFFKDFWVEVDDFVVILQNYAFGSSLNALSNNAYSMLAGSSSWKNAMQGAKNKSSEASMKAEVVKWLTKAGIQATSSKTFVTSAQSVWAATSALGYAAVEYFTKVKVPSGYAWDTDSTTNVAKALFSPGRTLGAIITLMESKSDYEDDDWGLDGWFKYLTSMPGWGKSPSAKVLVTDGSGRNVFGDSVAFVMAQALLDIYAQKFGAGVLEGAQKLLDSAVITDKDFTSTPATPTNATTVPASSKEVKTAAPKSSKKPSSKAKRKRPNVV